MKKKIKKLWVDALRSGKYEQGKNCLRNGNEYCCLGVLCDLHKKETKGRWRKDQEDCYSYLGCTSLLPDEVMTWADLDGGDPMVFFKKSENSSRIVSLVEINDQCNFNFNIIADAIEKSL